MSRLPFGGLIAALTLFASPAVAQSPEEAWSWPVDGRHVTTGFAPPDHAYASGHRGVDVLTRVGAPVWAVADGVVAFAGPVAGVGVVSVDHATVRSTYQPLRPVVEPGDQIRRGDVLGYVVRTGSHCAVLTCLHLGARIGDAYVDPAVLLSQRDRIRLIDPHGPAPAVGGSPRASEGIPTVGSVTSEYGWRIHPIRGDRSFHDGIDYGAPCGTPVRSTADGVVGSVGWAGAYGRRIEVDHGDARVSSYSHLSATRVAPGDRVARGDVVGLVGTTGLSTGCHLHYSVHVNGRPVAPT